MGTQWALLPIAHFCLVSSLQFLERLFFIITESYEHYEMLITAVVDIVIPGYDKGPKKELKCHTWCGTSWAFAGPVLVFRVGQIDPFMYRRVLRPVPACPMLCCRCITWLYAAKHDY